MAEKGKDQLDLGKEKEDKSSKVLLYVVIALIVVVLGMGGVLLYVLGVFGNKPHGGEAAEHEAAAPAAPAPPREPIYVPLDRDLVVNLPAGGEARLMQVGITVLAFDPAVPDILKKHMPMLRNNVNVLLAGQDAAALKKAEGKQALQAKLLEEVNKVIQQTAPKSSAEQVFFTSFILQ